MRKSLFCLAVAVLAVALPLQSSVVPPDNAAVRKELSAYFSNIAENSPTVLGGLAKSPGTLNAIQSRIATMSDAEISKFRNLIATTPDWKIAPEALAGAFPPEMLEQMKRVGTNYAEGVPAGEEMRDDVLSLVAILKVLPDARLKELGVDRQTVTALDATFTDMTPLQVAMLQRKASETAAWGASGAAAMKSLPAPLQRGAAALAQHGPITTADVDQLEKFRSELVAVLRRIDNLPPETRKSLKAEQLRNQVHQLGLASPDALFMVRHNVPEAMMTSLDQSVAFLERIANLSDAELQDLEKFRTDLGGVFKELEQGETSAETVTAEEMLASLGPEHLSLLKDGMEKFGNWRAALPVLYRTLASPDLPGRLQLVQGTNPDPGAIASLENFRQETLAFIDAEAAPAGIDAELIKRARLGLANAQPGRLEIMRMSLQSLPAHTSVKDRLSIALMEEINFNCVVTMPDPIPNINLDFICNPIEDALETIRDGIVGTVNTIVNGVKTALETTISTVSSALNSAISAVSNTVNSIISSIESLATQIWDFIQTVPSLAWNAIQSALNLLLDIEIRNGVTVRHLVASGAETAMTSMRTMLGLAGNWWQAVSTFTLPAIPCPPAGFHTPFGNVGEGAAAANYGRYKLVIENIIDMIPDTETSLAIKIPAQVLYMAFDFLGLCLEQAASDADQAQATERHNIVLANFDSLETYISGQIAGLSATSQSQGDAMTTLINTESSSVLTTLQFESGAIQTHLNSKSTAIQASLISESAEITSLVQSESDSTQQDLSDFRKLNLRLIIERVLQAGVGAEVAFLQLLEPLGHLGLVRDIVAETIAAMSATQQSIGQAQVLFDTGVALMNAGREKEAFKEFGKAYRDATK